jgi:hypothetical protein
MSIVSGSLGAVMGADATTDAANTMSQASRDAAQMAVASQDRQYDTSRKDFSPFLEPSSRAMATLQSAIYGGAQEYDNPDYTQLSNAEVRRYLTDQRITPQTDAYGRQYESSVVNGMPERMLPKMWKDAQGNYTATAPAKLSAMFNPQESESYKWQKERGLADLGRTLRAQGRGNSTYGMNATGRFLGDLNANEYDRQINSLLNLAKIGQGAAGSTSAAGTSAANNNSSAYLSAGQGIGNAAMMAGQAKGSLYGGMGGASASTFGNGLKLYDYGKGAGWWGGSGSAGLTAEEGDAMYGAAEYFA